MRPRRALVSILAAVTAMASPLPQAAAHGVGDARGRRHILILNSYHKEFRWTDRQVDGAKQVLVGDVDNLELYVEYMDTKRLYTRAYLDQLHSTYLLKYGDVKLDAVITTDDNALRFVAEHHQGVFGSAPVFFCGINDYSSFTSLRKDLFTGLVEVLDIKSTIDLIRELHPQTRKIAVVVDNTPTGVGQRKEVAAAAADYPDLEFEYLTGEAYSTPELLEKLAGLPSDCVVLLTVWLRDRNNTYAATDDVGKLISERSAVPVYGIIDMYLGYGIVGGKLLNSETHGQLAAEMAVRVLNGENVSNIPVLLESHNPCMFDDPQLVRWGIDPASLPEDSIILNPRFSLYESYRTQIWGIAAAFVALVTVIAALTLSIVRRKQAETALRESEEKHRGLTENIPQRIFHKDANRVYVSCNRQYAEDMGLGPEQA